MPSRIASEVWVITDEERTRMILHLEWLSLGLPLCPVAHTKLRQRGFNLTQVHLPAGVAVVEVVVVMEATVEEAAEVVEVATNKNSVKIPGFCLMETLISPKI